MCTRLAALLGLHCIRTSRLHVFCHPSGCQGTCEDAFLQHVPWTRSNRVECGFLHAHALLWVNATLQDQQLVPSQREARIASCMSQCLQSGFTPLGNTPCEQVEHALLTLGVLVQPPQRGCRSKGVDTHCHPSCIPELGLLSNAQ